MSFAVHITAPAIEMLLREILQTQHVQGVSLARIEGKLGQLNTNGAKIVATLADVKARVDAQGTVIDSAVTLINGISQQLKDALANNDPAAVQAVIDELDAQDKTLADAVVANTPAQPPATGNPEQPQPVDPNNPAPTVSGAAG